MKPVRDHSSFFLMLSAALVASSATGQDRRPLPNSLEGLAIIQRDADLDNGASFDTQRYFARYSSFRPINDETSVGFVVSVGSLVYDFSSSEFDPWDDIRDLRVSVPLRFSAGERATAFIAPQARWDYEKDADISDSFTYGALAGIAWRINDKLSIGPGFGAFTELEESGLEFFPALLIDWQMSERWSLTTGSTLGATEGPGLTLNYQYSDNLRFSLAGRYERIRFRLDDQGVGPDGVGEDENYPVVLSMQYEPDPNLSVALFAGAKFDGRLTLENSSGDRIDRETYDMEDTVPIFGLAVRWRF